MDKQDFYTQVYAIVKEIPYGRVTSYGAIAKSIGMPKSSRIVGYAMNASHDMPDVPAHRVVNRNGLLTGRMHFATPNQMEDLLVKEGILVKEHKVQNFEALFWDPFSLINYS